MAAAQRMRDVFIDAVTERMAVDDSIMFVSGDFGSPRLDVLAEKHPDRVLNVGIAEQNLINVSVGLALEGFSVFSYAIAPFLSMRCFEQVRVNLALLSQVRPVNVTLIGVGAGFSYELSGPTHQALEDISAMRTLPNVEVLSPSDWVTARALVDYVLQTPGPSYIRMDGKPVPALYEHGSEPDPATGFHACRNGTQVCLLATGYMTHKALAAADVLSARDISAGVIDVLNLTSPNEAALCRALSRYPAVLSVEEGFLGAAGLDGFVLGLASRHGLGFRFEAMGLERKYGFDIGERDALLSARRLDADSIAERARALCASA
jgi:transketolase